MAHLPEIQHLLRGEHSCADTVKLGDSTNVKAKTIVQFPSFMNKETEAQKWEMTFIGSHSWAESQRSVLFLLLTADSFPPSGSSEPWQAVSC